MHYRENPASASVAVATGGGAPRQARGGQAGGRNAPLPRKRPSAPTPRPYDTTLYFPHACLSGQIRGEPLDVGADGVDVLLVVVRPRPLQPAAARRRGGTGDDWASKVTEELSCDILIVGAGFSGTCAAVQAAQNGDSVIVCEGQSFMGGNGLGVECTNAYGLHPNSEGVSLGEMVAAEAREQAYTTNQMYTRDMIMHAADNVQWLIDNGVQYQPIDQIDEAYLEMYKEGHYGATYSFDYVYANGAAGQGFFPYMKKKLNEYGANLRLGTRVRSLIKDADDHVCGAYATDSFGDVVKINAKAVIVGTGGFGQDGEHWARLGMDINDIRIIGTYGHFGDGVNMMIEAGGIDHGAPAFGCTNIIGQTPGAWGPIWDKLCWGGPSLWVDIHGERFSDEAASTYTHNFELQNVPVRLAGGTCWAIYDAKILETMLDGDEDAAAIWAEMINEGDDAYTADTLDELADVMGVDKELFLAQVKAYNDNVASGFDHDYGKDPQYLMPIENPPFYCGLIRGALEGLYSGGVKTDRTFHVKLPGRDKAFQNLFAIGADGGMLYNFVYCLNINGSMTCHGVNNTAHEYVQTAAPVAEPAFENPMTVVKTIVSQLSLADLGISAADSPYTITYGDPKFDAFFISIEQLSGATIDSLEMTVTVTESKGAEIAATGEIPIEYNYTLKSLSGVVDGQQVGF